MKKDWRSTKWKEFSKEQKKWFIILASSFATLMIAAGLTSANNINIPRWAGILAILCLAFASFKFIKLTPWTLMGMESDDNDDDLEDNDTSNGNDAQDKD